LMTSQTSLGLVVRQTADNDELQAARRLHASTYLEAGFVDRLGDDGLIHDPWVAYSDYFVAVDRSGEVVGTCRLIRPSPRGLQTFQHAPLYPEHERFFAQLPPTACVEVSSLATKRSGRQNGEIAAALYALTWREAVFRQHAYIISLVDPRLLRMMAAVSLPVELIGPTRYSFGGDVTPTAVYVPAASDVYRHSLRGSHAHGPALEVLDARVVDLRESMPNKKVNSVAS